MSSLRVKGRVGAPDNSSGSGPIASETGPGLFEIGQQLIMPKHIWEKIADPANELNADVVGTGPYTKVTNFQAQSYELLKNPNCWQRRGA